MAGRVTRAPWTSGPIATGRNDPISAPPNGGRAARRAPRLSQTEHEIGSMCSPNYGCFWLRANA